MVGVELARPTPGGASIVYSCAETIHNVMEGGHSRLQYEYLSPHGIALFEDAVSRLNGGNRRAAVPAARVWHELQNELICHKCFDDYISLLEIYYDAPGDEEDEEEDPQQPGDDEEYANDAVDAGEEAGGVDAVGMDSVEEGMLEEVPADEEGAVYPPMERSRTQHPLPPGVTSTRGLIYIASLLRICRSKVGFPTGMCMEKSGQCYW